MTPAAPFAIGIDLGGTHVKAVALADRGRVLQRLQRRTRDGPDTLAFCAQNVRQMIARIESAGARLVVPCHFDLFEFNTASPELFAQECRRLGQPRCVLRNGEGLNLKRET